MEYIFNNERPIYIQLVEQLRVEIISGKLKPGEKIPSVREFALVTKVNPNTMQKALIELEREKLIYTERTNGKYVTKNEKLIEKIKCRIAESKIDIFLNDMKNIGISNNEIKKCLNDKERNDKN